MIQYDVQDSYHTLRLRYNRSDRPLLGLAPFSGSTSNTGATG